jgi:VanZ family protein
MITKNPENQPIAARIQHPASRISILLWLLPLGWSALIFWVNGRPLPEIPGPDIPYLDKALHIVTYAILSLLWYLAIRTNGPARSFRSAALAAFMLTAAYGLTDEYHQSRVDARTSDLFDWVADSVGAAIVWLIPVRMRLRPLSKNPEAESDV